MNQWIINCNENLIWWIDQWLTMSWFNCQNGLNTHNKFINSQFYEKIDAVMQRMSCIMKALRNWQVDELLGFQLWFHEWAFEQPTSTVRSRKEESMNFSTINQWMVDDFITTGRRTAWLPILNKWKHIGNLMRELFGEWLSKLLAWITNQFVEWARKACFINFSEHFWLLNNKAWRNGQNIDHTEETKNLPILQWSELSWALLWANHQWQIKQNGNCG